MVHQESLLAPHLTVAENIFLGHESESKFGWVRRRALADRAARVISENGFRLDPDARVEKLSPAGRQLVEICRAIAQGSSLLICLTNLLPHCRKRRHVRFFGSSANSPSGRWASSTLPIAWKNCAPSAIG